MIKSRVQKPNQDLNLTGKIKKDKLLHNADNLGNPIKKSIGYIGRNNKY